MNLLTSSNIFLDSVKEVLAHYEEFHSQNLLKIKNIIVVVVVVLKKEKRFTNLSLNIPGIHSRL